MRRMQADARTQANLRKGVLEGCTLAIIGHGDIYGRDLAKRLHELGLLASEGSLYPLLSRLRESGWVETQWRESTAGPPRRYYRLTPAGADAVRAFETGWGALVAAVGEALAPPAEPLRGQDDDPDDAFDGERSERNPR